MGGLFEIAKKQTMAGIAYAGIERLPQEQRPPKDILLQWYKISLLIKKSNADIIWVALGAPKQEIFMSRLKPYLNRGGIIAVGAVFGFYSKLPDVPGRSPRWLQKCHLEFVHRLFTEPRKQFKRCWSIVITLPKILYREYKAKKSQK